MREIEHRTLRAFPLLALVACLAWPSAASAGECGDPCTVTATVPDIHLVDTSSSNNSDDWEIRTEDGLLRVGRMAGNQQLFTLEIDAPANTLHVDSSGRIGINTTVPTEELQIDSTNPAIRLNDTSAGEGHAVLRVASNVFGIAGDSGFNILAVDTRVGSTRFFLNRHGQLGLGILSPQALLHVNGDARVEGDVALGSSRTLKTDFDAVDPFEVLAKLADLPVASWRYKTDEKSERHIGPFAEDFQRLFGLGDGATISLIDAQGVALAAIQGLKESLDARDAELAAVRNRNDELEARLTALSTADAELRDELQELEAAIASR